MLNLIKNNNVSTQNNIVVGLKSVFQKTSSIPQTVHQVLSIANKTPLAQAQKTFY